jgi:hypothetical protein
MRALTRSPLTALAAAATILFSAGAADAACKKMGFLVNDYGKDGPSKDAQDLLDKHIAEWAAQNGIKNYTVGKKDVKCELYIDVILFDEHTCTASANVCWDEPGKEKPAKSAKKKTDDPAAKSAENDEKKSSEKQPAAAAEKGAEEKSAEATAEKPSAATIETGAIESEDAKPAAAAAPAVAPDDAAARAAAAAERAAEAAERAAAAAERAAAASSKAASPSQLEMPAFGAGKPAEAAPATPAEPKS